jgi:hypothetical protein
MIWGRHNWSGSNTQESREFIPLIPGKIPDDSWSIIPRKRRVPKRVQAIEASGCFDA